MQNELHMRGHRAFVWRSHVDQLLNKGIPPSIKNIVESSDRADVTNEIEQGHNEYTGGTTQGLYSYSEGKRRFIISVLTASANTVVRVDATPDGNCQSCMKTTRRHCDNFYHEDNQKTVALVTFAQQHGYQATLKQEPHPLYPGVTNYVAYIPAAAIQAFVFDNTRG